MTSWRVIEGDCVEAMAAMEECSIDAVVCDPPYGLEFMGKEWDKLAVPQPGNIGGFADGTKPSFERVRSHLPAMQGWHEAWAREALRVLKPGGHLLAFGGTRTYHRLACAVEDAGFEIRDTICWLYGSGFPKSLDVSKAIDAAAGAERELVGQRTDGRYAHGFSEAASRSGGIMGEAVAQESRGTITTPATPEAEQWSGWGTALKPAHEPIVVARKPLVGTVAGNVLEHGTGALNIDGCRVEHRTVNGGNLAENPHLRESIKNTGSAFGSDGELVQNPAGRWPANVALDPDAADMLDAQTGDLSSGLIRAGTQREGIGYHGGLGDTVRHDSYGDSGGASRFFYVAKASRAERNAGLDGFEEKMPHDNAGHVHADGRAWDVPGSHSTARANHHPTVKPIALMRWLVRLVTPPGGTVLDPFTGSGTTGAATVLEGFDFIGCEREPEYVSIATARIAWWAEHPQGQEIVAALEGEAKRQKVAATGQLALDPAPLADETEAA